jgi:hypothetical protein
MGAMSERTASARELAQRIGISHTAIQKAERIGRIAREPDGTWDVAKARRHLTETALPGRSPLAPPADASPFARLKVALLALNVESRRMALDRGKGRLMDVGTVDGRVDEIAGAMRDTLLNWPARVSGLIAADLGVDPHLVQTVLQQHVGELLTDAADRFDPPEDAAASG